MKRRKRGKLKKFIIEMYKQKKNISREIAKKKKKNAKVDDNGLYGVLVIGYIRLHYILDAAQIRFYIF